MQLPAIGTRVKNLGDIANPSYTGTVVDARDGRWGPTMDVQPDAAEGEVVEVKKGIPCHSFPETGAGKRWVLAAEGERREFYSYTDYSPTNCD